MKQPAATVDFGAPDRFGVHLFRVTIPAARSERILIEEDYGYRGDEGGIPRGEPRVSLERRVWAGIADAARREFNDRLREAKQPTARWHSGENRVERLLGKELCVLAWAAEVASDEQLPIVATRWTALRREERWWLFAMTVAEAGLPEDRDRGWRKALYSALSDGRSPRKRAPRPTETDAILPDLFAERGDA